MPQTLAVEKGLNILRDHGPYILRTTYFEQATKKNLPRLQGPAGPHKTDDHDPHKEGRAIDIILFGNIEHERLIADELVQVFLKVREKMKWSAVIYNKKEWNKAGTEMPRGGDLINQHVTHIHIEWRAADAASVDWEQDLIDALEERTWVLDPGF
jgi:hypothetical protein